MTGDIPTKLVKAPNLPARCSWKTLRPPEPQGPPRFIDRCNKKYGYIPDDVAAPTWDSLRLVQEAIQSCGKITGNIEKDRKCVRNDLANIKEFGGITGKMTFSPRKMTLSNAPSSSRSAIRANLSTSPFVRKWW